MVGLHYLRHVHDLTDDQVLAQWIENPYWQYFCGFREFQWNRPVEADTLRRWRARIGTEEYTSLLGRLVQAGLEAGALPAKHP
jgi:IS5 family transposase